MFRTVVINQGERISVKDGWLIVGLYDEEKRVPIEDIYSVVIDNISSTITLRTITQLTDNGTHILVCNEKHQPVSIILPQNTHYRPLNVIRKQISMSQDFKNKLWDNIVKAKIQNQAQVLKLCHCSTVSYDKLIQFSNGIENGDEGNREAVAAKMFFRTIYGSSFIRFADDAVNSALNYGYAIIRSAFCKTLVAYGYNSVIGLHHINESNPFNLADDLMEPLRPVIDMWVDDNHEDLLDELTRSQRNELASIVNNSVMWNGKKMKIRNAIDKYVSSLTTAIEKENADLLKIPTIIRTDMYGEEDE